MSVTMLYKDTLVLAVSVAAAVLAVVLAAAIVKHNCTTEVCTELLQRQHRQVEQRFSMSLLLASGRCMYE
jgi:hypothetical protein